MNLEELNTTQIILLSLLISFVTSIATGIVTVSLINQAPPVVTETIHKVIEKTVEKIVPGEQKATVIENTTTVIVTEEDFIMEAIDKNSQSLVRIYTYVDKKIESGETPIKTETEEIIKKEKEFVALGVILSATGDIVATKDNFVDASKKDYFIFYNDKELKLNVSEVESNNNIVFLKVKPENNLENIVFKPITKGDANNLKLGQSVVALGGEKTDIVLTGIVSNLTRDKVLVETAPTQTEESKIGSDKKSKEESKIITVKIDTNLDTRQLMELLINLDGEAVGVKSNSTFYIPINLIIQDLNKFNQTSITIVETKNNI